MLAHTARQLNRRALIATGHRFQGASSIFSPSNQLRSIQPSTIQAGYFSYDIRRERHSLPYNTMVVFVPQQEAWVVERMGKFNKILEPGLNILFPVIDAVRYVQSLKEMAFEIPQQSAVTADNVTLSIDGVLYLKVFDPYKASYNIENPEFSVTQLAQTSMRSEIGKIQLDSVFRERESLNTIIVSAINNATSPWGISCLRYEIRDIKLPSRVQEAMQLQVEAERKKRAQILESEGARDAEINVAQGQANAIMARAKAKADALTSVSNAIKADAAAFLIAEQYVRAFSNLARTNNTLIIPQDASDINKMVAQAFSVYKSMSNRQPPNGQAQQPLELDNLQDEREDYLSDIGDAIKDVTNNNISSPPSSTKIKPNNNRNRRN